MNDEKLAVAVALTKKVKGVMDDLKAENAALMAENYRSEHITQRALTIGGVKVGTTTYIPPKQTIGITFEGREDAFIALSQLGLVDWQPAKGWQNHFEITPAGDVVCRDTGEVCEWARADFKAGYTTYSGCNWEGRGNVAGVGTALKAALPDVEPIALLEGSE